jgi:thymidylate kinase
MTPLGEQSSKPKANIGSDPARHLGRANILVEGIDGSGKDEFVRMLSAELKARFVYNPAHTLAIVGQPAFRHDSTGQVRALIEQGERCCSLEQAIELLTLNRQLHEAELSQYGGVVICLRGVLTELATLTRLFGDATLLTLGQSRMIDLAVIIDANPDEAYVRICRRARPPDWRETPEHLAFFRNYYLEHTELGFIRERIVFRNDGTLADLKAFAVSIADRLEASWGA